MKKKILVIDDSPFIKKQISDILKGMDYEVIGPAKSGEEGLEMYKELRPDIVTLDIIMPGIDGMETASNLLDINPNIKIIMISSIYDLNISEEIKKIGVKFILPKPIKASLFIATLNAINEND